MINVGAGRPFIPSTDVRKRACVRCRGEYLPPGAGNGMCSDRCWMASRGRQEGQGAALGRAVRGMQDRAERRAIGRHRVNRMLADAAQENDIARYKRERKETLELIDRAARRLPAPAVSRSSSPAAHCAGCQRLGATPQESVQIHAEITRMTAAGRMGQPSAMRTGDIVR